MMIYAGETDPNVLKPKMLTGEYVIIGEGLDRLSGGPKSTPLTEQLQIGDSISFLQGWRVSQNLQNSCKSLYRWN